MKKPPASRRCKTLPGFIEPCLATLAGDPPVGTEWAHEIKYDGYRLQAHITHNGVKLLTRTGLDWSFRFSIMCKRIAGLDLTDGIIDGEAVVLDSRGASSFAALVNELKARRSGQIAFVAFDLLFLNGRDLRQLPLHERKKRLHALLDKKATVVQYSEHIEGAGAQFFKSACDAGLEGIISKRLDRPYRSGRRGDWLKVKCICSDEFVIAGFVDSTTIKQAIGALALGYFDGQDLVYAGRVGTGFTVSTARVLWAKLSAIRKTSAEILGPLDAASKRGVTWVKPSLVAQVEYTGWTDAGLLRHASFKGLRADKPAKSIQLNPRFDSG